MIPYATAKAAVIGFMRSLSLELVRDGITVNCLAPIAKTRMTSGLPSIPSSWRPEQVSSLVAWLCSEEAAGITGQIIGARGALVTRLDVEERGVISLAADGSPVSESVSAVLQRELR